MVSQPKQKSTRYLKRYAVSSDDHEFIGRIYDLSIVEMNFDTYEELSKYIDALYIYHINYWLSTMVQRIESLNRVADMLWLEKKFIGEIELPVSRYDWVNSAADAFLMRFISISDGAMILTNEVFELGLPPKNCTLISLKRKGVSERVLTALEQIVEDHLHIREERNARFHHGIERELSSADQIFKMAAMFEHYGQGLRGKDINGCPINTKRYLREGLVELQGQFNTANRRLAINLNDLYDLLFVEFESRFKLKFHDPERGFGFKNNHKENE